MNIFGKLLSAVLPGVTKIIDDAIPDKDMAAKLKAEISQAALEGRLIETKAMQEIIVSEAEGESWLQRNWRPMVMLWFAVLVGAHWVGFTPENLGEEQVLGLLKIVQYGLSGYVVGRSGEKIVKEWAKTKQ